MARKGGNKKNKKLKKRNKKKFNRSEFIEIFCQTCMMCKKADPNFCYNLLYKSHPKPFINKVFNNLVDVHVEYQAMNRLVGGMSVEQFENVVCRTGCCYNGDPYASATCDSTNDCYKSFKRQMGLHDPALVHEADASNLILFDNKVGKKSQYSYKKKKRKKKKKARYVPAAYPTFFCRKDPKFEKMVRRIIYGDNDQQQNSDQELSASNTGKTGGSTKD